MNQSNSAPICLQVVLVEDESLVLDHLESILETYENIEILGKFTDALAAFDQIPLLQPNLIFLDINMPYLSGFDLLTALKRPPLVIFCTSHEEYAVSGYKFAPADFILKPFSPEDIKQSLEKALDRLEFRRIRQAPQNTSVRTLIRTHHNEYGDLITSIIPIMEIIYITNDADPNYLNIFTIQGHVITTYTKESLKHIESEIDDPRFFKIHKNLLINLSYVKSIKNNQYVWLEEIQDPLPISRMKRTPFKKAFQHFHQKNI